MKIEKTNDGQISIDLFTPKSKRAQAIANAISLVVIFGTPVVMLGLWWWYESTESAAVVAPPAPTMPAPVEATNTTPSGPTISQDAAIAAYTTGLYAIDGMKDLVSDIRTGYADGQVELVVTPYFENQPKATREDFAQSLWRAWVISSESQENTSRANIRLVNSRGDSVGGSGPLKGVYVDD